jgi:ring-1,2-phenylacetyl-CoA epoxidase subunit PaaD
VTTGVARPAGEAAAAAVARAREVLAGVPDPEIPVISVLDLGIVREVAAEQDGTLRIAVSPTYSGCPATAVIRADITSALQAAGFSKVRVRDVLSPPWTTDWISAEGRRKLAEYGIVPPGPTAGGCARAGVDAAVSCPRCGSSDTELLSEFGSTPCKALHRCRTCREPFDRFKCI